MSANIRCTFHHKGCQWVDQLCTLQVNTHILSPSKTLEWQCGCVWSWESPFGATPTSLYTYVVFLSWFQSHLDTCKYNTVPCPNNCHAQLSRICLDDHVTYTCLRRKVVCESCGLEFTGESMEVSMSSWQHLKISGTFGWLDFRNETSRNEALADPRGREEGVSYGFALPPVHCFHFHAVFGKSRAKSGLVPPTPVWEILDPPLRSWMFHYHL